MHCDPRQPRWVRFVRFCIPLLATGLAPFARHGLPRRRGGFVLTLLLREQLWLHSAHSVWRGGFGFVLLAPCRAAALSWFCTFPFAAAPVDTALGKPSGKDGLLYPRGCFAFEA